eukprot:COSAG01_NODE_50045_length_366_cov_41.513109_1_plen_88_part_01
MTVGPHGPHGPHGGLHAITPPRNGPHACQIPNRNAEHRSLPRPARPKSFNERLYQRANFLSHTREVGKSEAASARARRGARLPPTPRH